MRSGTPTMGGLIIIFATRTCYAVFETALYRIIDCYDFMDGNYWVY
jgi:UDP-N-acetylmuramyl pentapeptide phosphotransferase/UDP-N-acetylglucosamine-1-phosphate transferase